MNMPQRLLGKTGLRVSALSLGTVALGVQYGIQSGHDKPAREASIALLRTAYSAGINLFDTAPNYGEAEDLLGAALHHESDACFASKVSLPAEGVSFTAAELAAALNASVDKSRAALRRDCIDILQVHNLSVSHAANPLIGEALQALKTAGKVRHLGASVYTEDEAMTAMHSGWVDVLQVAYNVLDQRMAMRVFEEAKQLNIGVLTRSAFLKGALTPRARQLPDALAPLRHAVDTLAQAWDISLEAMPHAALAFCLGEARISSVLIGPSNEDELMQALASLNAADAAAAHAVGIAHALNDARLVDPRLWPLP